MSRRINSRISKAQKELEEEETISEESQEAPLEVSRSSEQSTNSNEDEGPRRGTSRSTARSVVPQRDDLWALGGKYPGNRELKEILAKAGSGKDAIPEPYTKGKSSTVTFKKEELLARALFFKKSRQLLLDFLKETADIDTKEPPVDEDAELSDFFIRFNENGVEYPGNQEETEKFFASSGIPDYRKKTTKTATSSRVVESFFSDNILKSLKSAVAKDDNPSEIDTVRQSLISQFLIIFGKLQTSDIEAEITDIKSRLEAV